MVTYLTLQMAKKRKKKWGLMAWIWNYTVGLLFYGDTIYLLLFGWYTSKDDKKNTLTPISFENSVINKYPLW